MGDGSLGYASRLSFRADLGGQLGSAELREGEEEGRAKVAQLAALIQASSRVVRPVSTAACEMVVDREGRGWMGRGGNMWKWVGGRRGERASE